MIALSSVVSCIEVVESVEPSGLVELLESVEFPITAESPESVDSTRGEESPMQTLPSTQFAVISPSEPQGISSPSSNPTTGRWRIGVLDIFKKLQFPYSPVTSKRIVDMIPEPLAPSTPPISNTTCMMPIP